MPSSVDIVSLSTCLKVVPGREAPVGHSRLSRSTRKTRPGEGHCESLREVCLLGFTGGNEFVLCEILAAFGADVELGELLGGDRRAVDGAQLRSDGEGTVRVRHGRVFRFQKEKSGQGCRGEPRHPWQRGGCSEPPERSHAAMSNCRS